MDAVWRVLIDILFELGICHVGVIGRDRIVFEEKSSCDTEKLALGKDIGDRGIKKTVEEEREIVGGYGSVQDGCSE